MKDQRIAEVPTIKEPIQPAPGFAKKGLADDKLDLAALCGFGCAYCSSNHGYAMRTHREEYADAAEQQLGERLTPTDAPDLMYVWPKILEHLEAQLNKRRKAHAWGRGRTLVFSMLTDGFSPYLVKHGITERALRLVLERTSFRIRVLTKSAIVGSPKWVQFFAEHADRFVVGLSIGTLDAEWAKRVEVNTSLPYARLRALRRLQEAGVPTYGMLCPVFPDVLEDEGVEQLIDAVNPDVCEHVWAEPFNDRANWQNVREGYDPASPGYAWLTNVYEHGQRELWSDYAAELYERLRDKAERGAWLAKLRYLLYEDGIKPTDAPRFGELEGVLLQSKPRHDGRSKNPAIAALQ